MVDSLAAGCGSSWIMRITSITHALAGLHRMVSAAVRAILVDTSLQRRPMRCRVISMRPNAEIFRILLPARSTLHRVPHGPLYIEAMILLSMSMKSLTTRDQAAQSQMPGAPWPPTGI